MIAEILESLMIAEILESLMMLAFGCAWPANILTSIRSRTTKGKSLSFLLIVLVGYACGIAAKLTAGRLNYVLAFYLANFIMASIDLLLYCRNLRLDRQKSGY
ncbi:MAG: hypothetical protein LBD42_04110 [Desulfovibrio sp.]|jgi:lipopolysaccharide export LptBFGC system permease protein LptF|nr:hypothetical protein [Desulfovibrio sp.]